MVKENILEWEFHQIQIHILELQLEDLINKLFGQWYRICNQLLMHSREKIDIALLIVRRKLDKNRIIFLVGNYKRYKIHVIFSANIEKVNQVSIIN
jgi:hypothetical protein